MKYPVVKCPGIFFFKQAKAAITNRCWTAKKKHQMGTIAAGVVPKRPRNKKNPGDLRSGAQFMNGNRKKLD